MNIRLQLYSHVYFYQYNLLVKSSDITNDSLLYTTANPLKHGALPLIVFHMVISLDTTQFSYSSLIYLTNLEIYR